MTAQAGRTGRPVGSGDTRLRVQYRRDHNNPAHLYIGRRLWQDAGRPARLAVSRRGHALVLQPVDRGGYAVTGGPQDTQPRLSVGMTTLEALSLEEGYYPARVTGGAIEATLPRPALVRW